MPFVFTRAPLWTALVLYAIAAAGTSPASYHLETVAGTDYVGDGGPASAAMVMQVEGVAVDGRGNLYLADAADHRVRKVSPSGVITTVAGSGRPGFSGDGGAAEKAQLRTPYGLAVDRNGILFIADLGNARIRRVTPDGIISTVAGGGTAEITAGGTPALDAQLAAPRNVATDSNGTLYFSDFGANRVYQLMTSGKLAVIAGTGSAGFTGDGGPAALAELNAPAGLAVDAWGAVFIADSANARIRKVWRGLIETVGDGGLPGAQPSIPVSMPTGLALDPDGSLFIADVGGNQMLRVTPALVATPVAQPARDVAIDLNGNVFSCFGGTITRRPRFGDATIIAGGAAAALAGDESSPERTRFHQPGPIARDNAGNLYVADTANHRIRKVAPGGMVTTIAGSGTRGFSGDSGAATSARIDSPGGIAVDDAGNLYIADTKNHRIRKIDPAGNIFTIAGTGIQGRSPDDTLAIRADLDTPAWVVVGAEGSIYFSEIGGHAVRIITPAGVLGTVAGTGTRGFGGDGGYAAEAILDSPQGIALGADGSIYIADAGNRRIRKVSPPSSLGPALITTVPDPNAAIWRALRGIAAGSDGTVYVTDAGDARVFRLDGPGQVLTIAGTGLASFTGESGPALSQAIDAPAGIVIDSAGFVYFSEAGNNRIRKLTPIIDVAPQAPSEPGLTVTSAASLRPGPIAPGQIVSIFGSGVGPSTPVSSQEPLGELGGTQVLFNGRLAVLFYASDQQLNLQVPYAVGDVQMADVQVVRNGVVRGRTSVQVVHAAPAIFAVSGGTGPAAALNENGTFNSDTNPALRGSIVVLFATGEGKTNPPSVDGRAPGFPVPVPVLPVTVKIGDYTAEVLYAGAAPGYPGLMQINARVPGGFAPPGILPVTVWVGSASSPPGVTIAVR